MPWSVRLTEGLGRTAETLNRVPTITPSDEEQQELARVKEESGQGNKGKLPDKHSSASDEPRTEEIGRREARRYCLPQAPEQQTDRSQDDASLDSGHASE